MFDQILLTKNLNILFVLLLIIGTTNSTYQNVSIAMNNSSNTLSNSSLLNIAQKLQSLDAPFSQAPELQFYQSNDCVRKFTPIISNLPSLCQSKIIANFVKNATPNQCCIPESFLPIIKDCVKNTTDQYTSFMTTLSQSNKASYSCFKNNEIFKVINNEDVTIEEKNADDKFLRQILLGYNELSHKLAKCISGLNTVTIGLFSRMCLPSDMLPIFFRKDNQGRFNNFFKTKDEDLTIFNYCSSYLKSFNSVSNVVLNSYIDQVNYLLGVDKCNYFSDFFSFEYNQDKNDYFYPKEMVPPSNDTLNSTNLLNKWETCMSNKNEINTVNPNLKSAVINAMTYNPNGLSTKIGRNEINFDIIKKTFYLNKFPYFYVKCNSTKCNAFCQNCTSLVWESNKVILSNNINSLDVSCCNSVCIVYINSNDGNGAEVFQLNGNANIREVDSLLSEKLVNGKRCFEGNLNQNSNISYSNRSTLHSNSSNRNTTETNNFNHSKFISNINDVVNNPKNYYIDFRLSNILSLKINSVTNTTQTTLLQYFKESLYPLNNSFYFTCENGYCLYQCTNCTNTNQTFLISPNFDNTTNVSLNLQNVSQNNFSIVEEIVSTSFLQKSSNKLKQNNVTLSIDVKSVNGTIALKSSSKSGGSSSKSGGSSSKSGGSSSKSGGSSSKSGGSSSKSGGSSSKKGGSALTGSASKSFSSYSSTSSSKYGGSSLTSARSTSTVRSSNFQPASTIAYSNNFGANFKNSYQSTFTSRNSYSYSVKTVYIKTSTRYTIRYYRPSYFYYNYYSPYYSPSWGFYNNYYVYNYNRYYYRGNYTTNYKSPYPSEYDPYDWMPSVDQPNDLNSYLTKLNTLIKSVKLSIECCTTFCVTYIESVEDGYSYNSTDTRKRIFIDFNMRNNILLSPDDMSVRSKKCLVDNLFQKTSNGTVTNITQDQNRSLEIPQTCHITSEFKTFPLKNSCRNQLSQYCGDNNFGTLIERFFPFNSTGRCGNLLSCENVTESSSESEKLQCGALFSSTFFQDSFRFSFTGLTYPCNSINSNEGSIQITSFIEKKNFLKLRMLNNTNTSSTTNNNTNTSSTTNNNTNTSSTTNNNTNTSSTTNNNTNTSSTTNNNTNTSSTTNNNTNTSSTTTNNMTNSTLNITSNYINISMLSSTQQAQLNNLKNAAVSQSNIIVSVDSNSDFMMNSNVETDLQKINSNVLASDYFSNSVSIKISYAFVILIFCLILL